MSARAPVAFAEETERGGLVFPSIAPSLFMRLSDVLEGVEGGEGALLSKLIDLLHARVGRLLDSLHAAGGQLHGDVSPASILLTHFGGVSLLQQRSNRVREGATSASSSPSSSSVATCYNVFPPFRGLHANRDCDAWGLACTLYTVAMQGRPPFIGKTSGELQAAYALGALPPFDEAMVSPTTREFIASLLMPGLAAAASGGSDRADDGGAAAYAPVVPVGAAAAAAHRSRASSASGSSIASADLSAVTAALEALPFPPLGGGGGAESAPIGAAGASGGGQHRLQRASIPRAPPSASSSLSNLAPSIPTPVKRHQRAITGSISDHTVSPVVARKLAAFGEMGAHSSSPPPPRSDSGGGGGAASAAASAFEEPPLLRGPQALAAAAREKPFVGGHLQLVPPADAFRSNTSAISSSTAPPPSVHEAQLEAARIVAFNERKLLAAKFAEFIHPVAAASSAVFGHKRSEGGGDASAGRGGATASGARIGEPTAPSGISAPPARLLAVAVEASPPIVAHAAAASPRGKVGGGLARTPPHGASAGSLPAGSATSPPHSNMQLPQHAAAASAPSSATRIAAAPSVPSSPLLAQTAAQVAYEEQLALARKEAFEARKALQARFGRG